MTHEESTGHSGPAPEVPTLGASEQPGAAAQPDTTTPIPAQPEPPAAQADAESAQPGTQPPPPGAGPATPPPPARPVRRARLGARWRTSLPLRVTTAVLVAILIGGIGFSAGSLVNGVDGHHRDRHELRANHPFWQDHEGWIHRGAGERGMHRFRLPPAAVNPPAATPAPAPAVPN